MMRVIRGALLLGAVALGGCQTAAEQRAAEDRSDDAVCRSYGLKFGTPAYAECRQRRDALSRQQALAALGALQSMQAAAPQPAPYVMPTRQPVSTSCSTIGGITNCTSY
jgi:hypothetical protein